MWNFDALRALHNAHIVIASAAKQSQISCPFNGIAASLALLAMTEKQLCKALSLYRVLQGCRVEGASLLHQKESCPA